MSGFIKKFSKEELINIIEKQSNGVFIINKNQKFVYVNEAFYKYTGFTEDEVIGQNFTFTIHEDYLVLVKNNFLKRVNNIEVDDSYEIKVKTKKGILDVKLNINPIELMGETYFVVITEDVTSKNELKKLLNENSKEYEKQKSIRNNFLMNISHEIRTPLNSIIGFVDLLAQEKLQQDKKETYLEIIKNVTSGLIEIVNDITDLSRIDEKTLKIVKNNFKIIDLLDNLKFTYNKQILEQGNNEISVITNFDEKNKDLLLFSDKFRINQILSNLIDNAIKYSNKGNIIISFERIEDKIIILVKDHGIGISKENQQNIFNRFSKVSYQKKQKGVGLGLTLSKKLALILGGDLYVESKLGHGSIFYLSLPYQIDKNKGKDEKIIMGIDDKKFDFTDKKILIIEDEQTNYIFLNEILTKKNAKVFWAKNGRQGVKYFMENNKNIDLILMDIRMPIMDGLKATEEIRQINKKIPIIAQTAYAMESEKTKSIEAGCNDFVVKPIKKNILFDKINKLLIKNN